MRHCPDIKIGIFAFDELISLGRRNNMMLRQVKQYGKMESHEEILHKFVIKNTSGCPWPSATLVHVLETFKIFIFIFMYFLFLLLFYIFFSLDESLKFGERRHTSFFFK